MKRPRLTRPAGPGGAVLPRIFAVLAATLLVGSIALASLMPADTNLRQAIEVIDERAPEAIQQALTGGLGHWIWESLLLPLLVRPAWLLPVCLGLICIGGAVTALSHASPRTKQRRS